MTFQSAPRIVQLVQKTHYPATILEYGSRIAVDPHDTEPVRGGGSALSVGLIYGVNLFLSRGNIVA